MVQNHLNRKILRSGVKAIALILALSSLTSCSWLSVVRLFSPLSKEDPKFSLDSTSGMDYTDLQTLLKRRQWQDADQETFELLLDIGDREAEGWLSQGDVEALSCTDLHTIANLWDYYSDGHFGWLRQQAIWERWGGQPGIYDPQIAELFGARVGWRTTEGWRPYDQLDFSRKAPAGHLPATTGNGVSGGVWNGVASITHRLKYCRLIDALATQEWGIADSETLYLFEASYMPEAESSTEQSLYISAISCDELRAVDELWVRYSNGRYGFTPQLTALKATGNFGNPLDWRRYEAFEELVDWPIDARWIDIDPQATYPDGHFPARMGYDYSTFGSAYHRTWRLSLNPACGFN